MSAPAIPETDGVGRSGHEAAEELNSNAEWKHFMYNDKVLRQICTLTRLWHMPRLISAAKFVANQL
jgi:hypothetical protein